MARQTRSTSAPIVFNPGQRVKTRKLTVRPSSLEGLVDLSLKENRRPKTSGTVHMVVHERTVLVRHQDGTIAPYHRNELWADQPQRVRV